MFKSAILDLYPPVSYNRSGVNMQIQAEVDSRHFERIFSSAKSIINGIEPRTSGQFLDDFERVYDITKKSNTFQQRIGMVYLKMRQLGGLSIPYFIDLAKSQGITITIEEPQPFRAGVSRAGDPLWPLDSIYLWIVNVQNSNIDSVRFRAGLSTAGERLLEFSPLQIEELFQELKPAHTVCHFNYLEA